jgi:uncharacterized RDD family membrane protein YckC
MNPSEFEYVGFWSRFGAFLVDSIIIMPLILLLAYMIYGGAYFDLTAIMEGRWVSGPADTVISYLLPAVFVVTLWIKKQATPGKMVIHAIIVDAATGNPMTTGQAIIRYLCYYVSLIPLFLGLIWVGFDSKKQGWHDKIAGTVVIRTK